MKVRPLGDRVVVEVVKAPEMTETGALHIPATAQEKQSVGIVTAVGGGLLQDGKRIPLEVKVGDKVVFGKYSGSETDIEGQKVLMIRESDIMAVVEAD